MRRVQELLAIAATVAMVLSTASSAAPAHDKAFWRTIAKNGFHPPADASVTDLAAELSDRLASPDPEWRDEIGYTTLTSWIYEQKLLEPAAVRTLMSQWQANLRVKIGSTGTDDVFRRSFSALMLSVVVARDNASPFLEPADVRGLLDAALTYFAAEQDVRGYVGTKGWAHSAAHTADLLKFLGRSRALARGDQARVLNAISQKLTATPQVLVFGEDERMARAMLSIIRRADFDRDGFHGWAVRCTPKFPASSAVSVRTLQSFQNLKNLFSKLEVLLSLVDNRSPGESAALDDVRAVLENAF